MNHLKTGVAYFAAGSWANYKFGSKELQESGAYDFGARQYLPDIGRWAVVDPLAEQSPSKTTYHYCSNNPISRIDPTGMIDGEFKNEKGEIIGNDGINDKKTYIIKTTQTSVETGAPMAGITEKQYKETTNFIKDNNGNSEAFKNNNIAYENSVEIPSFESRQEMSKIVGQDDGSGGNNLTKPNNVKEYGGVVQNDGTVKESNVRPSWSSIQSSAVADSNTKFGFHSHPSGSMIKNGVILRSVHGPSHQGAFTTPNTGDIGPHQIPRTNFVFQRGEQKVYIYNSQGGVQAIMNQSDFNK